MATDDERAVGVAAPADGDDPVAVRLVASGTVQGVGFRPFLARTAAEHDLAGVARNVDAGVEVVFEGAPDAVGAAVDAVRAGGPRLAAVTDLEVSRVDPAGREGFEVADSAADGDRAALVPPDTAICADCLGDLRDPSSRFAGYWATGCVDCGPRFAITERLPYDRAGTTLSEFEPCEDCRVDYEDPRDRRFHAQTIACPECGPGLELKARGSVVATDREAITAAADRIDAGGVVGLQGAGGSHLVCRARSADAVERLRDRLDRPAKPFAVMARSLDAVREFGAVSEREADLLTDRRRPIVTVERAGSGTDTNVDGDGAGPDGWLDAVAPGLRTVGAVLPYSGLHHLLFEDLDADVVVATSANRPGEPTAVDPNRLAGLSAADAALVHDRPVANRCDDSVVRVVGDDARLLRRSRGWVPDPLPRRVEGPPVLALGARSDVTAALARGGRVVPSQHVGTVEGPSGVEALRAAVDRLCSLLAVEPAAVAHDAHPGFETTRLAGAFDAPAVPVQHHHAHAASLLAEHGRDRAVVVAADGTGYGADGTVRGGEVLVASLAEAERVGGLGRFRLPGGEAAVERPTRLLASLLPDERAAPALVESGAVGSAGAARGVCRQAERGVGSPPTTSAGRFLDAAAALLDVCRERRYRGEPAMALEAVAAGGTPIDVDPPLCDRDGERVVDPRAAFRRLAELADRRPAADVAATAQRLLADGLASVAVRAARERGLGAVGFTGGVAYNAAIDRRLRERVRAAGLTYLGHEDVPPGDGGLSYGQTVVASARTD